MSSLFRESGMNFPEGKPRSYESVHEEFNLLEPPTDTPFKHTAQELFSPTGARELLNELVQPRARLGRAAPAQVWKPDTYEMIKDERGLN